MLSHFVVSVVEFNRGWVSFLFVCLFNDDDHLVGLVQFEFAPLDFSGLSQASGLKLDTQVATQPSAWRYRVSAGACWPSVSIL